MSGYDRFNKNYLIVDGRWGLVGSTFAATTSVGSVFQMCGAATAKARLPTVDSLMGGTTRRLALVERSVRRPVQKFLTRSWSIYNQGNYDWTCENLTIQYKHLIFLETSYEILRNAVSIATIGLYEKVANCYDKLQQRPAKILGNSYEFTRVLNLR